MGEFFADLHVHIGRTLTGKPVKITASRNLTLTNILQTAKEPKGLDIVGVIDSHSPEVIEELELLIAHGKLQELEAGGFRFCDDVTLICGSEIEIYDDNCQGPIHVLVFLPYLESLKEFSNWLKERVSNIQLSTQRIYERAEVLQQKAKELGGLFIPAHVFTPFKSLYGKGVKQSLTEVLHPQLIDGIELGLSSDTYMAAKMEELASYTFLTNSDAHSLAKIAREYQKLELEAPTFQAVAKALKQIGENWIIANYGMNPKLGKYYQTTCAKCSASIQDIPCQYCGSQKLIKGVAERIKELSTDHIIEKKRPPYIHHVPLEFIPGLGKATMNLLLNHFKTEMNILHRVREKDLMEVVKPELAKLIIQARKGELSISAGGGGKYGRVKR